MLLIASAWATPAGAQGEDDVARACIAPFERAQRARMNGKLVEARSFLPECLAETCPARVRDDCARMRDALDSAVPTAIFAVRDATGTDLEATFNVDGAPVELDAGRALPIDPGTHVLSYTLKGQAPRTTKIRIYEGERSRLIVINVDADAGAGASRPTAARAADKPHHTMVPFIIGGAGILLGAASLYFVGRANGYAETGRDAAKSVPFGVGPCQDFGSVPADRRLCEASENHKLATGLAFGLGTGGVLALGTAVLLYVVEARPGGICGPKCAALVVPVLHPTQAGASVHLSF